MTFQASVIVPVFNGEKYLGEAIESILAQRQPNLEILVVDDGSTDGSARIAAGFADHVRLIQQPNRGVASARNRGIKLAQSDILAFLDADDCFTPDKFKLQLQKLLLNPDAGIILGMFRNTTLLSQLPTNAPVTPDQDDGRFFTSFGCALIRKSVFDKVGLLSESMRLAEDWDWFTRAREARIRFIMHKNVVLNRRLHDRNLTREASNAPNFVMEMIRRSIDRRRTTQDMPESLAPLSSFLENEENT